MNETNAGAPEPLLEWHRIIRDRDLAQLQSLLAKDVCFHSPIVHKPQRGRDIATIYLTAACHILLNDSFRYVKEVVSDQNAALEFMVEIEGVEVNGVDLIHWNERGNIDDFKVMLRPLQAIELVHRKMREMLEASQASQQ
ncbi:MAG: nuclear transport factor 2 family protein [Gammaproteobacteria bacterium]